MVKRKYEPITRQCEPTQYYMEVTDGPNIDEFFIYLNKEHPEIKLYGNQVDLIETLIAAVKAHHTGNRTGRTFAIDLLNKYLKRVYDTDVSILK